MVAVADFVLIRIVLVVAVFFRKLLYQMLKRMHRLEQYRKQYRSRKHKIDYGKFIFHFPQM